MLEKRDTLSQAFGGEPFPATLNGPLPCRPPPDPPRRCLFLPSGPERNVNVSLSAASMARPSARRRESRGDTKAGAPGSCGVKEERHRRITTVNWRLNIQGTPTCRVVTVREISGGLV